VVVGAWSFPILHFDKAGLRKGKGFCLDGRHQYGSGDDKAAEQCRYRPKTAIIPPSGAYSDGAIGDGWSGVD